MGAEKKKTVYGYLFNDQKFTVKERNINGNRTIYHQGGRSP